MQIPTIASPAIICMCYLECLAKVAGQLSLLEESKESLCVDAADQATLLIQLSISFNHSISNSSIKAEWHQVASTDRSFTNCFHWQAMAHGPGIGAEGRNSSTVQLRLRTSAGSKRSEFQAQPCVFACQLPYQRDIEAMGSRNIGLPWELQMLLGYPSELGILTKISK